MTRVHLGADMKKVDLQGAHLHKKTNIAAAYY